MNKTILTSRWFIAVLLILPLAVIVIYELQKMWLLLTLILVTFAAFEWGRLCQLSRRDCLFYSALFFVLSCLGSVFLFNEIDLQHRLASLAVVIWVFLVPWWLLRKWHLPTVVMASVGMLLLFAAWMASWLLFTDHLFLLVVAIAVVCLNDSVAYFVGKSIGRTPLAATISPKKTVEGMLGGIIVALIIGIIFYWSNNAKEQPLVVVLVVIFAVSVLGVVGDLAESQFKRQSGVKDSGQLLGEHGGVLDRFDAMLPVLPFVFLLNTWII